MANASVKVESVDDDTLCEEFGIDYSRPSCQRLLKEAVLSNQPRKGAAIEAAPEDFEDFEEEVQNLGHVWMPR